MFSQIWIQIQSLGLGYALFHLWPIYGLRQQSYPKLLNCDAIGPLVSVWYATLTFYIHSFHHAVAQVGQLANCKVVGWGCDHDLLNPVETTRRGTFFLRKVQRMIQLTPSTDRILLYGILGPPFLSVCGEEPGQVSSLSQDMYVL